MKLRKFWSAALAFWTLLLALWTALCWNARAAESPLLHGEEGRQKSGVSADVPGEEENPLDVPFLDQREGFPTGCESVSAVMALRYFGADISVDEFVDGYLPLGDAPHMDENGEYVGCDPCRAFPGDPRSKDGWGCWAPVIRDSLDRLLSDRPEWGLEVRELEDASLETLCRDYVDRGVPVLVWASIGMAEPYVSDTFIIEDTGEAFQWIYPLHCMVLTGYDEDSYYFNDPLEGKAVPYPKEETEQAYRGMGSQALVLLEIRDSVR